ncbi:L/D-transpeptidase catalytic domain protein [Synechococcus sp. ROS8604]|nr:L/D-transpeptidase catalytic domain protein [Synechococcus sp. ROS8604]
MWPNAFAKVSFKCIFGCFFGLHCSIALTGISSVEAKAEIEIEVSLKEGLVWLKGSGTVIKGYPIAIGAPETPTIPGVYSILKKV